MVRNDILPETLTRYKKRGTREIKESQKNEIMGIDGTKKAQEIR